MCRYGARQRALGLDTVTRRPLWMGRSLMLWRDIVEEVGWVGVRKQ